MSEEKKEQTVSFRSAMTELTSIAEKMRGADLDIDEILPLVERAQKAYGVCRERATAVRAALAEKLPAAAAPVSE